MLYISNDCAPAQSRLSCVSAWGAGKMTKFLFGVLVGLVIAFGVVAAVVYVVPGFASSNLARVTKSKPAKPPTAPADAPAQQ